MIATPGNAERRTQPAALGLAGWKWRSGLVRLAAVVCLGAGNATAQAIVEYGGAASSAASITVAGAEKAAPALLPMRSAADIVGANRRALELGAGKDAAKLMLRSAPNGAWVRIDGKDIGKTPVLLVVAPGVYKVEMEEAQMESSRREVKLLPKETQEVLLTLKSRYPTHIELSWPRH